MNAFEPRFSVDGPESPPPAALVDIIRRVRARWRLRRVLTGLALAFAASVVILGISAWAMDALRYETWVVRTFQVSAWLLVAGALARFLWSPLRSRVTDHQVALYVEEHDASLRETVVSGVELGPDLESGKVGDAGVSPELAHIVVKEAIRRCEEGNVGQAVEAASLRRTASAFGSVLVAIAGLALIAPPVLHSGMALLFTPWRDISDANPYRILVEPGDVVLVTGSDRWIDARLEGFTAERVVVVTEDARGTRRSQPMVFDPEVAGYRVLLPGVSVATDYFVEAEGVRSSTYRIDVEDFPQVARLDLTYRYPAHTGLAPRLVEDGGDIAAITGTEVDVLVRTSVEVDAGLIRLEDGGEGDDLVRDIPLAPGADAGGLVATLELERQGAYRIALADDRGRVRTASRDYAIEVLEDLPPLVRFVNPGRDIEASAVEEVFTEVFAEDDYAIRKMELRWSVNGGDEVVEPLAGAGMRREIQTGHTLFLEEHDLVPGDLLAYYAIVEDGAGNTTSTDLYFVAIRRLDRTWRQADSMPGGGGGGQAGDALDGTLTLRQKQVVVATFKAIRERPDLPETVFSETVATVGLAQGRLREQVGTLARRLRNRGIASAPEFAGIVEELEAALGEMAAAEEHLVSGDPDAALPPEQKALAHLQRADATFAERQVAFGGGGGGGGGAPTPQSEDLARLFELEMDKLRNQYETVEQRQRSSADDEVDEVMERLAELARRQEQENARRGLAAPPGGAGANQRQIAEETEEMARRLERLARERSRPDLAAVSRRLQEAAQRMRSAGNSSEGVSSGLSAAEQLRGARRELDSQRRERLDRDVENLTREVRRLRATQDRIRDEVAGLGRPSAEAVAGLQQQKEELAGRVQDVERELDRVSREWSRDEPEASRAVGEAARGIRDRKLKEKIHYSRGVIAERTPEYADQFEAMIAQDLESLEKDLSRAGETVRGSDRAVREDVLDRAGALVRGMESLRNRLADREGRGPSTPAPSESGADGERADGSGGGEQGDSASGPGAAREEARQLRRELDRRIGEAENLRGALGGAGGPLGPERLDGVLQALRGLSPEDLIGDPRAVEHLELEVLDALREFEFDLRRQFSGDGQTDVIATGAERAPEGYEEMVEEYFRALGRAEPGTPER